MKPELSYHEKPAGQPLVFGLAEALRKSGLYGSARRYADHLIGEIHDVLSCEFGNPDLASLAVAVHAGTLDPARVEQLLGRIRKVSTMLEAGVRPSEQANWSTLHLEKTVEVKQLRLDTTKLDAMDGGLVCAGQPPAAHDMPETSGILIIDWVNGRKIAGSSGIGMDAFVVGHDHVVVYGEPQRGRTNGIFEWFGDREGKGYAVRNAGPQKILHFWLDDEDRAMYMLDGHRPPYFLQRLGPTRGQGEKVKLSRSIAPLGMTEEGFILGWTNAMSMGLMDPDSSEIIAASEIDVITGPYWCELPGRRFLFSDNSSLIRWDAANGTATTLVAKTQYDSDYFTKILPYPPNPDYLVTVSFDRKLCILDASSGAVIHKEDIGLARTVNILTTEDLAYTAFTVSLEGKIILVDQERGSLLVYGVDSPI